jgi:hypothetical protein
MKLGDRERWMCALLPGILIVLLYAGGSSRAARREIASLRREIAQHDPAPARDARLDRARAESGRLAGAIEAARARAAAGANAPHARGGAAAMREASRLGAAAGVTVTDCRRTERSASRVSPPWPGAEAWRLAVRGGYSQMLRFLDALAEAPAAVVPAGLALDASGDGEQPLRWTLTVCLDSPGRDR